MWRCAPVHDLRRFNSQLHTTTQSNAEIDKNKNTVFIIKTFKVWILCNKMSTSLTRQALVLRRIQPSNLTLKAMFSGAKDGVDGSIGAGGDAFAKIGKGQEAQFFNKVQREQLKKLKSHLDEEVTHHESEIKRHQERIQSLKDKSKQLDIK